MGLATLRSASRWLAPLCTRLLTGTIGPVSRGGTSTLVSSGMLQGRRTATLASASCFRLPGCVPRLPRARLRRSRFTMVAAIGQQFAVLSHERASGRQEHHGKEPQDASRGVGDASGLRHLEFSITRIAVRDFVTSCDACSVLTHSCGVRLQDYSTTCDSQQPIATDTGRVLRYRSGWRQDESYARAGGIIAAIGGQGKTRFVARVGGRRTWPPPERMPGEDLAQATTECTKDKHSRLYSRPTGDRARFWTARSQ